MPLISGCDTDPGALVIDDCETIMGQVREMILIKAASYDAADRTSASALQALIDGGNAYYFPKVRGEYPEPETKMGEGFGDDPERLVNKGHMLNIEHNVIKRNRDFWNTIRGGYYLGFRTNTPTDPVMLWSTVPVYIVAGNPVPASNDEQVVVKATIKWEDQNNPEILDYPGSLTPAA